MDTVAVLLPVRGRHDFLPITLQSLFNSNNVERMELIIVVDHDYKALKIVERFIMDHESKANEVSIFHSAERVFSVRAFNIALSLAMSDKFIWVTNTLEYHQPDWFSRAVGAFTVAFSDDIGVLSLGKKNKANYGMSSRAFIEYNEGDWFHSGYKINFCDDELACRAILLGRYMCLDASGIIPHPHVVSSDLLYESYQEKIRLKKIDRGLFYQRSETHFGLPEDKIYKWEGFNNIILPLKGRL